MAVPKPETVVAEPSANVTLGRLLDCSRSESKPEVLVIWSVAPKSNDPRVLSGKTSSGSTLLSQSSSRIKPNKVGMQRQEAIVLFLRNRDYSRCWWK